MAMLSNFPGALRILEDGQIGIIVSRLTDDLMLEANQAFLHMVGFTSAEVIGLTARKLDLWVNPAERDAMVVSINNDKHCYNLPVKLRRKTGEIILTLCSALVIDRLGEPYILTLVQDQFNGTRGKGTLDAEDATLDHVEESGGIGFWDFDAHGDQVRWSYGMEAIYGLPKGSFKGTIEDFVTRIHPEDVSANLKDSQEAIDAKRPFDVRFRILRPDGSERWVVSRGAPRFLADGSFSGAWGYQIDISEQVQRDLHLRLQSEVISNMAEGMLIVSAKTGKILYANPCFERMLGYRKGCLEGLPVASVNASTGQDPVEVANTIITNLHRHGLWRGELKNRCADGSELLTACTVSEFNYEGLGKVWIAVHANINEERLAQRARDKALVDLQRLSLKIQDSVEDERTLVARDVHDQLGASLTGMRMKLEAIHAEFKALSPSLAQKLLVVFEDTRKMQVATRDICSGLRPALLDDMGLADACRWYVNKWTYRSVVSVKTQISQLNSLPKSSIETDMFRVLQELLNNVAKHSGAKNVQVSLSSSATTLKLRVGDDGDGFNPEHDTSGYGLMGIRERIRSHMGELNIESGKAGTCISVTMKFARKT